ncbi:protein translocase subunit SecF [Candidatus Kaiserbacteria bacterium]|nr:protein translocase subunit SecF [Candidatus Kaiserbacteria bacterium]
MLIVTYRKVFFTITGVLVAASLVALFVFGLHLSTDFTGGTLVDIHYDGGRPGAVALSDAIGQAGVKDFTVREAGENGFSLRAGNLTSEERQALTQTLSMGGQNPVTIDRLSEIGPTIGVELRNKSILAVSLVLLCILLFIAFAFRKVSRPVSSWGYGLIALITLVHNVLITLGFFALLGYLFGAQVDTLFVTAVLTVLGFSVHDTIVVFDRIRENLRRNQERNGKEDFEITVGKSLNQTFVRSVNTSLTVVITLLALFFVGPASTQNFVLTLLAGIIAGTYSSLTLASPLLVVWEKSRNGK